MEKVDLHIVYLIYKGHFLLNFDYEKKKKNDSRYVQMVSDQKLWTVSTCFSKLP